MISIVSPSLAPFLTACAASAPAPEPAASGHDDAVLIGVRRDMLRGAACGGFGGAVLGTVAGLSSAAFSVVGAAGLGLVGGALAGALLGGIAGLAAALSQRSPVPPPAPAPTPSLDPLAGLRRDRQQAARMLEQRMGAMQTLIRGERIYVESHGSSGYPAIEAAQKELDALQQEWRALQAARPAPTVDASAVKDRAAALNDLRADALRLGDVRRGATSALADAAQLRKESIGHWGHKPVPYANAILEDTRKEHERIEALQQALAKA